MLKITIIALGNKLPNWIQEGVIEYQKRLQDKMQCNLIEIPLLRRGKSTDIARILDKEMSLMKCAIPQGSYLIPLDLSGQTFTSQQLALRLEQLQHIANHLCFLIGGPEGLSYELLNKADERWALSQLTLPHTLARLVFMEAIYRGWCILHNHPYHK